MASRQRALMGVLVVASLAWTLPASAHEEARRPPPPAHDRRHDDYPARDADDHPYDWQPTHDHRRVRHLDYADCGLTPDAQLVCHWQPVTDLRFAAYEVWVGSSESEPVLAATVANQFAPVHAGPNPLEGEHALGFAIRVLDQRGDLLAHTFPGPLASYDRRVPRGAPARLRHLPSVPPRAP